VTPEVRQEQSRDWKKMKDSTVGSRCSKLAAVALGGALLWTTPALADPPAADAPPPGAPPAAETPPPPPPPAAPPPAAPPPAVQTETKPPTAAEAMPAARPEVLPPIDVGAWTRVGGTFQGATDHSKLSDWHMSDAYVELHAGGKIHKNVGVTLNLVGQAANYSNAMTGNGGAVSVEDAIISFDLLDEFHIWAGHLLVMVDRDNSSGPFFMIPWNYPGFFAGVAAPAEGPFGRNNGVNVWGDINGGLLTYFLGVYDNGNVETSPLFSGRLRLSLLDKETGFWGNGSYFGDKDILSFDLGGQYQKNGSVTTDAMGMVTAVKNYSDINVDGLFEKKLGGAGSYLSVDAAYYHYGVSDLNVNNFWYGLVAWASPVVGVGNIQPMVRYQGETFKNAPSGSTKPWNIDAAVAYLIKGPALRLNATYSHTKLTSDTSANAISLNAQAIFF
jgi:hypothetical protein